MLCTPIFRESSNQCAATARIEFSLKITNEDDVSLLYILPPVLFNAIPLAKPLKSFLTPGVSKKWFAGYKVSSS
jgi:hypothetical protein